MWITATALGQNLTSASISELARKTEKKEITNAQFWRALGTGLGPIDCSDRCEVEHQDVAGFESGAGYDELVMISRDDYSRILLVHNTSDNSKVVAYVDPGESRYNTAEGKAISSGGKVRLRIKTYPRGGTGIALFPSVWYELYQKRFRRVLGVPSEGRMLNADPAREFETRFIRRETVGEIEMLKFVYSVKFFSGIRVGSSVDMDLWQDERIVTFSRKEGQAAFQFDLQRSETAKEFVDFIFSFDDTVGLKEDRTKYYRLLSDHLLEIARSPRDRRREWLRQLLERERDIPSLEPARKAFANAR